MGAVDAAVATLARPEGSSGAEGPPGSLRRPLAQPVAMRCSGHGSVGDRVRAGRHRGRGRDRGRPARRRCGPMPPKPPRRIVEPPSRIARSERRQSRDDAGRYARRSGCWTSTAACTSGAPTRLRRRCWVGPSAPSSGEASSRSSSTRRPRSVARDAIADGTAVGEIRIADADGQIVVIRGDPDRDRRRHLRAVGRLRAAPAAAHPDGVHRQPLARVADAAHDGQPPGRDPDPRGRRGR